MNVIDANFVDIPSETHTCDARREGDWIIFTCKSCPSYERRINFKTRMMQVKNASPEINHKGNYYPDYLNQIVPN